MSWSWSVCWMVIIVLSGLLFSSLRWPTSFMERSPISLKMGLVIMTYCYTYHSVCSSGLPLVLDLSGEQQSKTQRHFIYYYK